MNSVAEFTDDERAEALQMAFILVGAIAFVIGRSTGRRAERHDLIKTATAQRLIRDNRW
jgi:hypothetical protein